MVRGTTAWENTFIQIEEEEFATLENFHLKGLHKISSLDDDYNHQHRLVYWIHSQTQL